LSDALRVRLLLAAAAALVVVVAVEAARRGVRNVAASIGGALGDAVAAVGGAVARAGEAVGDAAADAGGRIKDTPVASWPYAGVTEWTRAATGDPHGTYGTLLWEWLHPEAVRREREILR
jgi:hypothetical protein